MALPTVDMLSVLIPELRFQIYSYVFSTGDEGPIVKRPSTIKAADQVRSYRARWQASFTLPRVLALCFSK